MRLVLDEEAKNKNVPRGKENFSSFYSLAFVTASWCFENSCEQIIRINVYMPIYGGGKFTPFGQAFSTFLCAISADFSLPPLLSLTPKWSDGNYETQGANTALTHISSAPHKSSAVPCSKEKGVLYFGWHAAVLVLVLPTTWPNGINLQKHNIYE